MKFKSLMILMLGLWLGYYFIFSRTEDNFEDRAHEQIIENEPVDTSTYLEVEDKGNPVDLPENPEADNRKDERKRKTDLESLAQKSKTEKKKKDPSFNPKKEVRFKVIEGYAIAAEDIILGKPKDPNQTYTQSVMTDEVRLWPNAEVPFAFDAELPEAIKNKVQQALKEFSEQTSIRFFPYSGYEQDFVVFTNSQELCASYVGRAGGAQPILLSSKCGVSEITHEMVHALGFIHEHQRANRDRFLRVNFQNIQEDKVINFDILPETFQKVYANINERIDMDSLLIYPSEAFVKTSGQYSIERKESSTKIPHNTQLSRGDIEKIQNVYIRKF